MCFDKDSSLLAWTLSYSISMFLFYRNRGFDRWNAGFIICFATIQLLEAGLWAGIEENTKGNHSKDMNDMLTRIILLALVCQPLIQTYMGYKYTKASILGILSYVFLGIILWTALRLWKSKKGEFSSAPGPNGHLIWTDSKSPNNFLGGDGKSGPIIGGLYFVGLFLPLVYMALRSPPGKWNKAVVLMLIGAASAVYCIKYAAPKEFSSYWCFTAVSYSIAALFV
jgi:hypothetical protein